MIIKRVKVRNIRSYEEAEVEFPSGSVLLSGDIGSGKTSILLAIEFALFGLQPGQKGASLLRTGKKEGYVCLELELDGKPVIIERTLKREKTVSQDYAAITINDEKKETSITELKAIILSLLNYPPEFAKKTNLLYRFTVYTPQEEMKQIILEDPETRLNTLRHIFGIDKYKRIKENTAIVTLKLMEEIKNKQGMIFDLEEKKARRELKLAELEKLQLEMKNQQTEFMSFLEKRKGIESEIQEIERKIEEKKKFENEIDKAKVLIASKKEMLSSLARQEEQLAAQIEESKKISFDESEINRLAKSIEETQKITDHTNKQYIEISSLLSSLAVKNSDLEKLRKSIAAIKMCPTCLQDVSAVYKANILNRIDSDISENKEKILKLIIDKDNFTKKLDELKEKSSSEESRRSELLLLKVKLESVKERILRIEEIRKQKVLLEKDLSLLGKHIENLRGVILDLSKYDNIYNIKSQELEGARRIEKASEIKFENSKREMEISRKEIDEISVEIGKKEEIKSKLAYISELEDWLSSSFLELISFTERNVMLKLREEFSKLFNEWFNILVPETFSVRLDEDFTPVIEQQDSELDYSYLSGGERTAIALAYRLALNQTINSLLSKIKTGNIVILDEPTDGFSEQQLDKMRDVLSQLKV
jgi:exonuclease SbcC